MTQHEIFVELYHLSTQRQAIEDRINELTQKLYKRDEFKRFILEIRNSSENEPCEDENNETETETETQPQNGIESNILHIIRDAKKRNHKGFYAGALKNFDDTYRQVFESLVESGRIIKTRIKTNYYYVENF